MRSETNVDVITSVTYPAVPAVFPSLVLSRWENGRTAEPFAILPVLAELGGCRGESPAETLGCQVFLEEKGRSWSAKKRLLLHVQGAF